MLTTFKELEIGDKFTFANHVGFFSVCTKISARGYEWHTAAGRCASTVGSINVRVRKES